MSEPPAFLTLRWCPVCERSDLHAPKLRDRHYWAGYPCKGVPQNLPYTLDPRARSGAGGEGRDMSDDNAWLLWSWQHYKFAVTAHPSSTLRALASIWRDHPDFQEEWA